MIFIQIRLRNFFHVFQTVTRKQKVAWMLTQFLRPHFIMCHLCQKGYQCIRITFRHSWDPTARAHWALRARSDRARARILPARPASIKEQARKRLGNLQNVSIHKFYLERLGDFLEKGTEAELHHNPIMMCVLITRIQNVNYLPRKEKGNNRPREKSFSFIFSSFE